MILNFLKGVWNHVSGSKSNNKCLRFWWHWYWYLQSYALPTIGLVLVAFIPSLTMAWFHADEELQPASTHADCKLSVCGWLQRREEACITDYMITAAFVYFSIPSRIVDYMYVIRHQVNTTGSKLENWKL